MTKKLGLLIVLLALFFFLLWILNLEIYTTGKLVLTPSNWILGLATLIPLLTFVLYSKIGKARSRSVTISIPADSLRRIKSVFKSYEEKGGIERYARKIHTKLLPHLQRIVKDYKPFLHSQPEDIKNPFLEVYYSTFGPHQHYKYAKVGLRTSTSKRIC